MERKVQEIFRGLKTNGWKQVNIHIHPNGVAFANATGWSVASNELGWGLTEAQKIAKLVSMSYRVQLYTNRAPLEDRTKLRHH